MDINLWWSRYQGHVLRLSGLSLKRVQIERFCSWHIQSYVRPNHRKKTQRIQTKRQTPHRPWPNKNQKWPFRPKIRPIISRPNWQVSLLTISQKQFIPKPNLTDLSVATAYHQLATEQNAAPLKKSSTKDFQASVVNSLVNTTPSLKWHLKNKTNSSKTTFSSTSQSPLS